MRTAVSDQSSGNSQSRLLEDHALGRAVAAGSTMRASRGPQATSS